MNLSSTHAPLWLGIIVLLALPAVATAQATPKAAVIAHQGNGRGAPPCLACHSADGGGQATAGFPRLAGLPAAYLARQLDSYANGSRDNPVMTPIANALSEAERQALASYYSELPIPQAAAAGDAAQADNALGRQLALHGRWSRQVPGCVACHGPHGVGVGKHFPPLAGQPATYIANQLDAWRDGTRSNDPLNLMKHVATALTEQDIRAVSEWFAAQPATLPEDTP